MSLLISNAVMFMSKSSEDMATEITRNCVDLRRYAIEIYFSLYYVYIYIIRRRHC